MSSQHVVLQEAVQAWLQVRNEKAHFVREYNEQIKDLEEQIKSLSDRIEQDKHQQSLPME